VPGSDCDRHTEWSSLSPVVSPIQCANSGEQIPVRFCAFKGCSACYEGDDPDEQRFWLGRHLQEHHADAFGEIDRCFEQLVSCDPNDDVCAKCDQRSNLYCCLECSDSYCEACIQTFEPGARPVDDLDVFWSCPKHTGRSGCPDPRSCAEIDEGSDSARASTIPVQRLVDFYTHAIGLEEEDSMPMVGHTLSRRCERLFQQQYTDEKLQSLVCFSCARVLPYDESDRARPVRWHQAFKDGKLCGMDRRATLATIGFNAYQAKYVPAATGDVEGDACRIELLRQLKSWTALVPFRAGDAPLRILCCLEDRVCSAGRAHSGGSLCRYCNVPVCTHCAAAFDKGELPAMALANDLFIAGHDDPVTNYIYEKRVTVIEMLAASPVHPAVLSYELDMHDRQTTVGSKVWNRPVCDLGFLGASGNVTGFMLPWERVFSLLKSTLSESPTDPRVELPRTGGQLHDVVQLVLRCQQGWRDSDDTREQVLKKLIVTHCRRQVN
jgi:hypothetical protein